MIKNITRRIRLFLNSKKEPYLFFYHILGFYPDNVAYYELALRHKSAPVHTADGRGLSNERLEFLGDAVLNSVVTDLIYHRFEDRREGFLTNLRAKIVSRESLNRVAIKIGLDKMVIASKYVNQHANDDIYGNALEALMGAIYLDYGYRRCKSFVENCLFGYFLDWDEIVEQEINFKSKVFEWCHKNGLEPEYVLLSEKVESNRHTFYTSLKIQDQVVAEAAGKSKKESQQEASRIAYEKIQSDPDFAAKLKGETDKPVSATSSNE